MFPGDMFFRFISLISFSQNRTAITTIQSRELSGELDDPLLGRVPVVLPLEDSDLAPHLITTSLTPLQWIPIKVGNNTLMVLGGRYSIKHLYLGRIPISAWVTQFYVVNLPNPKIVLNLLQEGAVSLVKLQAEIKC